MNALRIVLLLSVGLPAWGLGAERVSIVKRTAQSANFRVVAASSEFGSDQFLQHCERLRAELQSQWLAQNDAQPWQPKCQIVVHSDRASYLRAVGQEGAQTFGSSLIQFEGERPMTRQIDLLIDPQGELTALSHELSHVVLADRFRGRQPPRWLDEGIATMADAAEKRRLHERDCQAALRGGSALRMVDVLHLDRFTGPHQVPAFYGQSLSLVEYLAARSAPHHVVDFAETAADRGYDRALRQHYDIRDVAMLEREWRRHVDREPAEPAGLQSGRRASLAVAD
ncbi:MAG: hypothetical protein U0795_26310 [Pirellulales bacterium]